MTCYSVWAPNAIDIQLVVDSQTHPMRKVNGDWWLSDIEKVTGQRYGFSLFDGENWSQPYPDPRSTRQPDGVHGLSEVTDSDFNWTDHDWTGRSLPGQVIYELHVGTFTPEGTFDGVIDKLDYLKDLGVNTVELMPVQPFAGERNWGYDGVSWFAVHEAYGGREGLKRLVDAAHAKGIAVILDVVYNHFGPEGNYNGLFGPYQTVGSTGWGDVVNLIGHHSDEVRAFILDAVRLWLEEFHIDGLRLDAVHALNDTGAYHLLEEISEVALEIEAVSGIPRTMIAESDQNDPRLLSPRSANGFELDAQWDDDIHHALHALVSGERHAYYCDFGSVEALAESLQNAFFHRRTYSSFRGRVHGRAIDNSRVPAFRFITYTTTHDQTGNRAAGDRPSMNLSPEAQVLKAAVVLCSPYTPMLFMGEEFGAKTPFRFFVSHGDENLNTMTREGRLREFARLNWDLSTVVDPDSPQAFEESRLDWDFSEKQQSIFGAYSTLLRLRRELGLNRPHLDRLRVEHGDESAGEKWIAFGYMGDFSAHDPKLAPRYKLIANFSDEPVTVPIGGELIYSYTSPTVSPEQTELDPWGFALVRI